ncbi:MAG: hypothetical protein NZ529_04090 [Cytophagaceae bacterium]|nr:hypothetical protein [Cytophagaceae bacterium]MDW8455953.1 hypothetical protein [Cytophagaceae bacterium]
MLSLFCKLLRRFTFSYEPEKFERTCARDGSHGLQGQCGALAEHRSDSGVANSPAPQGRAQHEHFITLFR